VVYIDHVARLSGGEVALVRLLEALGDAVDAHVLLAEDGPLKRKLEAVGATVEVLPMPEGARGLSRDRVHAAGVGLRVARDTAAYCLLVARRLRELRPQLVHTNSLKAGIYGGIAARLAGVPAVWHVHDRIAADYLPRLAVTAVRALVRALPRAAIANSEATLATLRPTARGRSRYRVIPYVIPAVAERSRGGTGPLRVGMIGRIAPWKGQDVFLRAFARAFPGGSERAVVVGAPLFGEEGFEQRLRALAAELDIADRTEFRGFREDVEAELARLDIVVHASVVAEPFGQVVAEAMAAGLPVVASAAGGPSEIVDDESNGLLYAPGDVPALAERLRRLGSDPGLRERLGAAGRERAGDYAPERVAAEITALYRQVLDRKA
jgi:glycosyltransferase involved in cell wall biosynthesis